MKLTPSPRVLYLGGWALAGLYNFLRERMVGIINRLDPDVFKRVHRSTIVNLDHVSKRLPWFGGDFLILMNDGTRLTVSRNFKGAFDAFEK